MFTVFSKDNCDYCTKAVEALKKMELPYVQVKLGRDIPDKQTFIGLIQSLAPQGVVIATVPQIFKEGAYIGGYDDLMKVV